MWRRYSLRSDSGFGSQARVTEVNSCARMGSIHTASTSSPSCSRENFIQHSQKHRPCQNQKSEEREFQREVKHCEARGGLKKHATNINAKVLPTAEPEVLRRGRSDYKER